MRRVHGGVEICLGIGHERDLCVVQRLHVVDRGYLPSRGEVAERVELHEVGALQRAGDTAIARAGKSDHGGRDPQERGEHDCLFRGMTRRSRPSNPRDEMGQAAHSFSERDHRSSGAMTDFGGADRVHANL